MLLIRGVGSEEHARQIEQGIVGCRDVASILLNGIGETGYLNSNYHEWLLQQSLFGIQGRIPSLKSLPSLWERLLRVALDPLLMGSYLTYFHIFDPAITEKWLDECWDDDAYFIFYKPHFKLEGHKCLYNPCYCGAPITYVNTPEEISPRETVLNNLALLTLLNDDFDNHVDQELIKKYIFDCVMLLTPLFNRIQDKRFDSRENEFRLYVREPRKLTNDGIQFEGNFETKVECDGEEYLLNIPLETMNIDAGLDMDLLDESGNPKELLELAWTSTKPSITSQFKPLDITGSAHNYGYIGNREDCRNFIKDFSTSVHTIPFCAGSESPLCEDISYQKLKTTVFDPNGKESELNEPVTIIRFPDKGCFPWYGPGFRESSFPNPIELGLFDPQTAFADAIRFLVGTKFPDDTSAAPRELSREFLHSSLDPWLPTMAMRRIPGCSVADEVQHLKIGEIGLKTPTNLPKFKSLFNLKKIKRRLEDNLTPKNMNNYCARMASRSDLPIESEQYKAIAAMIMSNFSHTKQKGIRYIIRHLPEGYNHLIKSLRCATFDPYDEQAVKDYLANADGIIVVYELDPYNARCNCDYSAQCDGQLLFSLTPSIPSERIDLSKFSYAITPQIIWEDYMGGARYAVEQTALCLASNPTGAMWTMSCGQCPNLSEADEISLILHPKTIFCGRLLDNKLEAAVYRELSDTIEVKSWSSKD